MKAVTRGDRTGHRAPVPGIGHRRRYGRVVPARARRDITAIAAAVVAFLLPMAYSPSVYATFWSPKAAVLVVGGALGLAAIPRLLGSAVRPAVLAALGFLGIAAVSTVVSQDPSTAVFGLFNWGTGLVFVACLVGMWCLGASIGQDTMLLRNAMLAGVAVSCGVAILQTVVDLGLPALVANGRASGLAGNPVHLGTVAAAGYVCCVTDRRRFALVGVIGFAVAAQISGTRLALLVVVGAGLALALRDGWRRALAVLALTSIGLVTGNALATSAGLDSATGRSDERALAAGSGGSIRVRLEVWSTARHAVASRPIFGAGPGRFRAATERDRTLAIVRAELAGVLYADGHNLLVEYTVTTGIAGLIALLVWLATTARIARGPLASVAAALLLMSLAQPQSVGTTPLLALAAGASVARLGTGPTRRWTAAAMPIAAVVGGVAAMALLVGSAALLRLRNDFDLDAGRRADALLHPWPQPALLIARAHSFRSIDSTDPSVRRAEAADARRWARIAVHRDESDPGLWINLAELERGDGLLDDASDHYRAALDRDRFATSAMVGLARVAIERGDDEEAVEWLDRALDVEPHPELERLRDSLD
jgi:O-antigen ligase